MLTTKVKTLREMIPLKGWIDAHHERPTGKPESRATIQKGPCAVTTFIARNGVFQKLRFRDKTMWIMPSNSVAA